MPIRVPELSLVVLIGPSGSGKSTFAAKHFAPTEILSSDRFRAMISDDEADQSVTPEAFELLHHTAQLRLRKGKLTVIDATNVERTARAPLLRLAKDENVMPVAIVLDVDRETCARRDAARARQVGVEVVEQHRAELERSIAGLEKEGFRRVTVLRSAGEIERARIVRAKLPSNRRDDHGPFDVIGDVHGCAVELHELLARLGYVPDAEGCFRHPGGRRAIFLGDLVDRGPDVPGVLRTAMAMVRAGSALCIPGNHEAKLSRKLAGKNVKLTHGLAQTVEQLAREPESFSSEVRAFIDGLVTHYVLDEGRLVVAHAGLAEGMHGRASGRVRELCLYGDTTGEVDELGLPVRRDWAEDYRGTAVVVYGHTPIAEARWVNETICIDTGCVFGGKLSALRWPERELVDVPAKRIYYAPKRAL